MLAELIRAAVIVLFVKLETEQGFDYNLAEVTKNFPNCLDTNGHIGHRLVFVIAKWLQAQYGNVIIYFSDGECFLGEYLDILLTQIKSIKYPCELYDLDTDVYLENLLAQTAYTGFVDPSATSFTMERANEYQRAEAALVIFIVGIMISNQCGNSDINRNHYYGTKRKRQTVKTSVDEPESKQLKPSPDEIVALMQNMSEEERQQILQSFTPVTVVTVPEAQQITNLLQPTAVASQQAVKQTSESIAQTTESNKETSRILRRLPSFQNMFAFGAGSVATGILFLHYFKSDPTMLVENGHLIDLLSTCKNSVRDALTG